MAHDGKDARREGATAYTPVLSPPAEDFRLGGKNAAIVVGFAASLLLLNLGGPRALTYHETLFAQPAREMVATGRWALPRYVHVPSTHKPPGAHWAIAAMMTMTGSQAEGVVRIPSALAGVVTALLIGLFAARWFGPRVGLFAGLAQATTYYVLQLARLAECDMLMIASLCGAMFCFAAANVDGPRGRVRAPWVAWLFYLCVGLTFLFKGLIGPAFIFSGCGLFLIVNQDLRAVKFFLSPTGIAICSLCVFGWFAAAYAEYPTILDDQIWHHFSRFEGDLGGQKDPLYYLYSTLLVLLPWTPFILGGVIYGLRQGLHAESIWRFVACWALPGFVLLQFSAFKSKHYAAPLLPPLSVIAAMGLLAFVRFRGRLPAWRSWVAGSLGAAVCLAMAGVALRTEPKAAGAIAALLGLFAVGCLALAWLESGRYPRGYLAAVFVMCWMVVAGVFRFVIPSHDSYLDQAILARRVNEAVPAETPVFLVGLPENQVAYYVDRPMVRVDEPGNFPIPTCEVAGPWYVLAPEHVAESLAPLGSVETLDRCASVNRYLTEKERMTLFRVSPSVAATERTPR